MSFKKPLLLAFVGLLVLAGMLPIPPAAQAQDTPPCGDFFPVEPVDWAALLYLSGDSNLTGMSDDIMSIVRGWVSQGQKGSLSLVIVYDGGFQGDSSAYVWSTALGATSLCQLDMNLAASSQIAVGKGDELNTGDEGNLTGWIQFMLDQTPAEQSAVIVMDHGNGWSINIRDFISNKNAVCPKDVGGDSDLPYLGFGDAWMGFGDAWMGGGPGMALDFHAGADRCDYLSTSENGAGFAPFGPDQIAIVYYDACLMGMMEEAYELIGSAQYYIAAQNLLYGPSDYEGFLNVLLKGGDAKRVATGIAQAQNAGAVANGIPSTIAVWDLKAFGEYVRYVNQAADFLLELVQGQARPFRDLSWGPSAAAAACTKPTDADPVTAWACIDAAYFAAQKFDYDVSLSITPYEGFVDFESLAGNFGAYFNGFPRAPRSPIIAAYTSGANKIARDVNRFFDLSDAGGMSIYFPAGEVMLIGGKVNDSDCNSKSGKGCFAYHEFYVPAYLNFAADLESWSKLVALLWAEGYQAETTNTVVTRPGMLSINEDRAARGAGVSASDYLRVLQETDPDPVSKREGSAAQ